MSCFKGKYKDKLLIQELVGRKNRTIRMGPPLPLSSSIPSTCCLQGAQNVFDWPAGDGSLLPGVGSLVCADPCPSGKVRCWSHPGRQRPPPIQLFSGLENALKSREQVTCCLSPPILQHFPRQLQGEEWPWSVSSLEQWLSSAFSGCSSAPAESWAGQWVPCRGVGQEKER